MTETELHRIIVEWNENYADYPRDAVIHELFEQQAAMTPSAVALEFENQQLSYGELNRRANQLAHRLRESRVGPEVMVGICISRSVEMIVGILGILKAGGAYVPLDPDYPSARLAYMLSETRSPVLLTQSHQLKNLPVHEARVLCVDRDWSEIEAQSEENPQNGAAATNLAYVIFTSGSTGRPKGVLIEHRGLCKVAAAQQRVLDVGPDSRVLQFASLNFDASIFEICMALAAGGTLVLAPSEMLLPGPALLALLRRKSVSITLLPPSVLAALPEESLDALFTITVGGEVCPADVVDRWGRGRRFVNLYGPTEATIWSTYADCIPGMAKPPIGRPVPNTTVYILDEHMQPVRVGVQGELFIGGDGLARGYLNQPEMTAEAFIENPFGDDPQDRLYRTGDVCRWQEDGMIEFCGRRDFQVKIRGFRVELGEIEGALQKHSSVNQAVVVVREDESGDKRLVAYIVPDAKNPPTAGQLRGFLSEEVPAYMVPAWIVLLESMPLTPNGKIDRNGLPLPEGERLAGLREFVAPDSQTERELATLVAEVLSIDKVGMDDRFLELGGHSLLATQLGLRVQERMNVEITIREILTAGSVRLLANRIDDLRKGRPPTRPVAPIEKLARDGTPLPTSYSQVRAWLLQQREPSLIAYNYQGAFRFNGSLAPEVLQRCLAEIVRRHEIYRTTFPEVNGEPVQQIHEPWSVDLPVIDLQHLPESQRHQEARRRIRKAGREPFDLARLPLVRWMLFRIHESEHWLAHIDHHLVHDGWSVNVLLGELLDLYQAYSRGEPSPLAELPIQTADFAAWQRQRLQGEVLHADLNYWKQWLAGIPNLLQLPYDRPRPPSVTHEGDLVSQTLPVELCRSVREFSRRENVTLFMTMQAIFAILMQRFSGQDDVCVGTGIANRCWPGTEQLIGMVLNNVVIRNDLSGDPTFRELLDRVRVVTQEAYAHQDAPFDQVVEAVQPPRSADRHPLYQVMFSFHDAPLPELEFPELRVTHEIVIHNGSAKFDLNVIGVPREGKRTGPEGRRAFGVELFWEFNTDLFDRSTIERMTECYAYLLEQCLDSPDQPTGELKLLRESQRRQLVFDWNATSTDYPRDAVIHEMFEHQVVRFPDAVAVVFNGKQLTYRELNTRANQLAHFLRKQGVGRETMVGLCLERSLDLVVGMLGILKAGGAYVPLDSDSPSSRLAYILADTQAPVLLTQSHLLERLTANELRVICLDCDWPKIASESRKNPQCEAAATNLAYVIYTSGSTGRPKGTTIPHRGVVRLVKSANYVDLSPDDVFLQFAPISFDASTFELWGSLLNGSKLVIFPPQKPSLEELGEFIEEYRITTLWLTSALLTEMVDTQPRRLTGVRQLLAGGDVLSAPHVKRLLHQLGDDQKLINGYGPTENTTFTCCHVMDQRSEIGRSVPIGRPISNTTAYILDEQMQPVPVGVTGELYTGGDGLARGYLNQPELTAEKFLASPFSHDPEDRLYRTGDRCRWREDGTIEFCGRGDFQVKIRGFRVELGEIEWTLQQHPAIREAVVVATGPPTELVAYLVLKDPGLNIAQVRDYLRRLLPSYMVPPRLVTLDSFPMTSGGKIDRRALPDQGSNRPVAEKVVAPRTETEKRIAEIWRELLSVERIGVHDNFFDLGGHSLLIMQVKNRLQRAFQVSVSMSHLFALRTIAELALEIEGLVEAQG